MGRAFPNDSVHLLDFVVGDRGLCGFACATVAGLTVTSDSADRVRELYPGSVSSSRRPEGEKESIVSKVLYHPCVVVRDKRL
jgi:hypothetical protein